MPELANASQWIDYYNELYRDSGSTEMPISDYARQMYLSGRDPDLYPNVDWVNTIFKDLAMTGRVHASVTAAPRKSVTTFRHPTTRKAVCSMSRTMTVTMPR